MNEADPRVKRTRKLLQQALISLLAEKSFHAISVQDITERATLNRATFYAHFEDKFALMDYLVRETFREEVEKRVGNSATFTVRRLPLLVVTVCEFMGSFHGHCAPPTNDLNAPIEAKVQDELYAYILDWLHHDQWADMPPESVAAIMSWAIFGAGMQWSRGDRATSAKDLARQVVTVLLTGVAQHASPHANPETKEQKVAQQ
ncbi:MAG TPA: TetR/AcrR family transcriptional regulator [Ktedonobacterales bacterium]|jgi:AcrR family transcriptional regulator